MSYAALALRTIRSRWFPIGLVLLLVLTGLTPQVWAVQGNIQPLQIQIDGPAAGADHYPNLGTPLNGGATADWSKTASTATNVPANTGTNCLETPPIATCNQANVTAAANGKGEWNGVRIVDGVGGGDKDIFLTGGKELDFSTWNVGPGSIGSRKYDMTQGYLANNQQFLYAAGERNGNNGTTAFVIEFNQAAPQSTYIPTRTVGDVQFVFEMQGSGNEAGSVANFVYEWNGSTFVSASAAGLVSSINGTLDTPSPPWGHVVNDQWVTTNLIRREMFEAQVPLSLLPGVDACGGFAYVQFRTRASSGITSDLKDATPIFKYEFGGPSAEAALSTNCEQQFTYDGSGSTDSSGGTSNLTYDWTFTVPAGVTLSGGGVTGPDANGAYHSTQQSGTVNVGLPAGVNEAVISASLAVLEGTVCVSAPDVKPVTVYRKLEATAAKSNTSGVTVTGSTVTATAVVIGSAAGAETFQWQRQTSNGWENISGATASTLNYSSFEADATPSEITFSIDSDNYNGKLWVVNLRLHVTRTITLPDGSTLVCEDDSDSVTVKMVRAVDP